jgi:hypothetical protein
MSFRKITVKSGDEEFTLEVTEEEYLKYYRPWWQQKKHEQRNRAAMEQNGYKSTPVFGYKKLTRKLLEVGCTVKGVPGFYQDRDGEWTIHFSNKSSGFLVPVRNMDHMIVGAQIRLDHPYDGRKYIWLSSTNFHMGTSFGSPVPAGDEADGDGSGL